MTAYIDLTYYKTVFLGIVIADDDLPRMALRASAQIDNITFRRAGPVVTAATDTATIDLIKMATCAVAEELQAQDLGTSGNGIQSESVGSNSVSYTAGSVLTFDQKIQRAARTYLGLTGLMYKGFADGEYSASWPA